MAKAERWQELESLKRQLITNKNLYTTTSTEHNIETFCNVSRGKNRELYYQDPSFYRSQSVTDKIINNLSCMLQVPRRYLHILATSKGYLAGNLQFLDADGNYLDCSSIKSGISIPLDVDGITQLQSFAKLVLVIEKDATFQKIVEDNENLPPHILVTGKGYPDLNTRQMVKKLWDTLQIPILILVDADPFGIEIMFVYRFGSLTSSYDCQSLSVPSIKWLGLLPSDVERLQIPQTALLPLTDGDRSKLSHLLQRPYCKREHCPLATSLTFQLNVLQDGNFKAEIQSLYSISPRFLCGTYIPSKILRGGWV